MEGKARQAVGRVEVSARDGAEAACKGGPVAAVFRENAELRREVRRLRAEVQMLRDGVRGAA